MIASPQAPQPTRLGRWRVRAKIADGGMATVYVGQLTNVPGGARPPVVALKVIREEFATSQEFLDMFRDESRIIGGLQHPNIVQLHELGMEGRRVFLAMELLFGQALWNVWEACRERRVRLRYDMIAWIGARVADGLHYAHEARDKSGKPLDIVHRDVNATNIFVTYDGQIKIIDFGLAKAANRASKTAAGVIKGKVAYMSPEQAVGHHVDRRTDIFALGTTLWELSVDRRLFKHTDEVETLKRVNLAEVPDPTVLVAGYPPDLWRILKRALARDKNDRFSTAAEMARELDAVSTSQGRVITPPLLAEVMNALFANERARQAAWLADASAPDRPAPVEPLMPRSSFYAPFVGVDQQASLLPAPPAASVSPYWQPQAARATGTGGQAGAQQQQESADPGRTSPTVRPPVAPDRASLPVDTTLKSVREPRLRTRGAQVAVAVLVLAALAAGVVTAYLLWAR